MVQKLVSIYKNDLHANDSLQEEHLDKYLNDGWIIKQIVPLDGSGGGQTLASSGWVFVLLEK